MSLTHMLAPFTHQCFRNAFPRTNVDTTNHIIKHIEKYTDIYSANICMKLQFVLYVLYNFVQLLLLLFFKLQLATCSISFLFILANRIIAMNNRIKVKFLSFSSNKLYYKIYPKKLLPNTFGKKLKYFAKYFF